MIRILIADDHVAVRQMLRTTLNAQSDMEVVAEASDGAGAVRAAQQHHPDVILLDVKMSGEDGLQAARELRRLVPATKILMLTALEDEGTLLSALKAGAHGFLLKSASVEEILEGVRVMAQRGGSVLSPRSAAQLVEQFRQGEAAGETAASDEDQKKLARLTNREKDVLALLSAGLNNREIGERLFISELTAKTHVQNLLRRLEVRDRFQAAALGIRANLGLPGVGQTE